MTTLKEYRCPDCAKLLFKGILVGSAVEIKCKRCNVIKEIRGEDGQQFFCYKEQCPNRVSLETTLSSYGKSP